MLLIKKFLARLLIITMLLTSTGMITFATSIENIVESTIKVENEQTKKIDIKNESINKDEQDIIINNEESKEEDNSIINDEENNDKIITNQIIQEEKQEGKNEEDFINAVKNDNIKNQIDQKEKQGKNAEKDFTNNNENQTEQKQNIGDNIISSIEKNNQNANDGNDKDPTNNEKPNDTKNTVTNEQDELNNDTATISDTDFEEHTKIESEDIDKKENGKANIVKNEKEKTIDFATTSNTSAEAKKLDETINVSNENNLQNENVDISTDSETALFGGGEDIATTSEQEVEYVLTPYWYVASESYVSELFNIGIETINILQFPDACPTEVDEKWDIPNSNGLIGYRKGKDIYIYAPTRGTIYTDENSGYLFAISDKFGLGCIESNWHTLTHQLPLNWYDSEVVGIEKNEVTKIEFITDLERLPSDIDVQWNIPNSNGLVGYRKGTDIIICASNECDCIGILDEDYKYIFSGMTDNISFEIDLLCLMNGNGYFNYVDNPWFIKPNRINDYVVNFDSIIIQHSDITYFNEVSKNIKNIYGLNYLNTSRTINMSRMFEGCSNLTSINLSTFDTSKVKDMSEMFYGCSNLTSIDLSSFDTSKVEDMSGMFKGCSNLTSINLSSFDTSKVEDMSEMFEGCINLTNIDLSSFDTSKVEDMLEMFYGCSNLTSLDLSNFNTTNVSSMYGMFNNCNKLETILVSKQFVTDNIHNIERYNFLFHNCVSLVGGNGTSYTTLYRSLTYARIDTPETPGYFTSKEQFINNNKASESEIKNNEDDKIEENKEQTTTAHSEEQEPTTIKDIEPETTARQNNYRGGSSSGGGGGGGGGSRIAPAELLKTNAITNTTLSLDFKSIPISFTNQTKSKWQADDKGKWHLTTTNNFGQTETVKNSWACIETDATVNGKQIKVTNFYFFDKDGNMLTGWLTDNTGKKYYLDTSANSEQGKMVRGWKNIENNYYYFTGDGILLTNSKTPDGYTVGIDGKWVK